MLNSRCVKSERAPRLFVGAFPLLIVVVLPAALADAAGAPEPAVPAGAAGRVWYEPNVGQAGPAVEFVGRAGGLTILVTPSGIDLAVVEGTAEADDGPGAALRGRSRGMANQAVVRMRMRGGRFTRAAVTMDELPGKSHYLVGHDPKSWRTNVPRYARIEYRDVYPGVSLVLHGQQEKAEYDFVVAPGAEPSAVELEFEGAEGVDVEPDGRLVLRTKHGGIRHSVPRVYQEQGAERKPVAGRYKLRGANRVGFTLGPHDRKRPLVIDPTLEYETAFGGSTSAYYSGAARNEGWAIAVDGQGNSYVTGYTTAADFPTTPGALKTSGSAIRTNAFVTKLDASGNVVYSTYLGGSRSDVGYGIAVDAAGRAYVTGYTRSSDFPTVNAVQPSKATDFGSTIAFLAKLDSGGSGLLYSTYLGGSTSSYGPGGVVDDEGLGVAVDDQQRAYVVGLASSAEFVGGCASLGPNTGAGYDGFLVKVDTRLAGEDSKLSCALLGGSWNDGIYAVALDATGVYVVGETRSPDFMPSPSLIQAQLGGDRDGFAAKLSLTGTAFRYFTYLGGHAYDYATAVAVQGGQAVVVGTTYSRDFPTAGAGIPGALDPDLGAATFQNTPDGFAVKLNAGGTALVYATYLGGLGSDFAFGVAVDGSGSAYVASVTYPVGLPGPRSVLNQLGATGALVADAFDPQVLGDGTIAVNVFGIATDATGSVWIVGYARLVASGFNGRRSVYTARFVAARDRDDPAKRGCSVGRPVSLTTGNVWFDETDVAIAGWGPGLRFTRSYNSTNAVSGRHGVFGPGWNHALEKSLKPLAGGEIMFREADGVPQYFKDQDGDGRHEASAPISEESSITVGEGGFTRWLRVGGSESYDGDGRLVRLVDAMGNTLTLDRDADGRLSRIGAPEGPDGAGARTLSLSYSGDQLVALHADFQGPEVGPGGLLATYAYSDGRLQSVRYPDGSGHTYSYDAEGQLTGVADAAGVSIERHSYLDGKAVTSEIADGVEKLTLAYGPDRTTVTDALGNVTTYEWQEFAGLKQIVRVTGPCRCGSGGETQEWTYDSAGRMTSHRDGAGSLWTYAYDQHGDLVAETDPLGRTTTHTRDSLGRIVSTTDPTGAVTRWTHDAAGPTSLTDPLGRVTAFAYDARGKLVSITDPRGGVRRLAYGASGLVASETDPMNGVTRLSHDGLGRVVASTDPVGNTTRTAYDARGGTTRTTLPDGTSADYAYDAGGRRTTVTDALARVTRSSYDAYGRLVSVQDPEGGVTSYGYDDMSRLVTLTDARGRATRFDYDGFGRLVRVTDPAGLAGTMSYDAAGRLEARTDRNGVTTTHTYDAAGQLLRKSYSDATPDESLGYDLAGRLTLAVNGADRVTRSYDAGGQLVSESSLRGGSTLSFSYDASGNRVGLGVDGTPAIAYELDALDRVTGITRGTERFGLGYDQASRRTRLNFPNGVLTSYAYDPASRLLSLSAGVGGRRREVADLRYSYDAVGNRTARVARGEPESYGYDRTDRLLRVERRGAVTEAYSYDAVGNRLSSLSQPTWTYGERNELVSNGEAQFSYDAEGRLVTRLDAAGLWEYAWNAEGRLVAVSRDGNELARFAYDALGRRVEKNAGGVTHGYVYDGDDILTEREGGRTKLYVHGPGIDEPLAVEEGPGRYRYYHADGLGSVLGTSNARGQLTRPYAYDAFGNLESGAGRDGYAFTGREWDPETGLYYYRARYYDPKIGRFLSADPARSTPGRSFYAYVSNNPVNLVDPSGLAEAPGFWEGFIPIWGSGRQALNDFECGRWGWGVFNTAMAASDVVLAKSIVTGIGKGAWKFGSHSWGATRKWLATTEFAEKGQPVHHWLLERNQGIGKNAPDWLKNQPWNLMAVEDKAAHDAIHGVGPNAMNVGERLVYGTPTWAKAAIGSAAGRAGNALRSQCGCN